MSTCEENSILKKNIEVKKAVTDSLEDKIDRNKQTITYGDSVVATLESKIKRLEVQIFLESGRIDQIVSLEAKNGELERQNEMLSHQLKYAETILTEVQADKYKLREKLEILKQALFDISEDDENVCLHSDDATEALATIEQKG